jgi:translation initiation factor 2B subunit (eIF-2B alpha/beta/delta family)
VAAAWEERLRAAAETLAVHARRSLLGASIVHTYSASSTVRSALLAHAETGAWFQVVLSESRPGGEGARLAVALAERGIPVRLGVDAWLWGALEEEGLLLFGADALLPTAWVNKVGTVALAERARSKGVPVVVCADTSKWLPPALAALPRVYDRDPGEIVFRAPAALEAVNVYFEDVPYTALDKLVTERGVTRPQDLRMGDVPVARSLVAERR